MNQSQFEDDYHICSALGWLANASGNPLTFFDRLEHAQEAYRNFTGADVNRGQDPQLSDFSQDINAAFLHRLSPSSKTVGPMI